MRRKKLNVLLAVTSALSMSIVPAFAETVPDSQVETDTTTDSENKDIDEGTIINPDKSDTGEVTIPEESQLDEVEESKTGSISVTLTDGKQGSNKAGIKLKCTKIAEIEDGEYKLLDAYKSTSIDFTSLENSDADDGAAKSLAAVVGNTADATTTTDESGKASFSGLEVGVYLITAEDTDTYDTISPSLLAIPTWNENEGDMIYDVSVEPKHTPKPDTSSPEKGSSGSSKTAPQTNVEDHTKEYITIGSICFAGAVAAATVTVVKKKKNK